jgi:hypothetical protein
MNISQPSAGSVTISGVVILQAPRPVDPQKGPRNIVFDANFYIVEGSQTVTMALLRYFAPSDITDDIQRINDKPFQQAFVVANVLYLHHNLIFTIPTILILSKQSASVSSNNIAPFMADFEPSDYAFVGDISQVCNHLSFIRYIYSHFIKLIFFDGDVNMQTNPHITVTGNVTKFESEDRTFTMTPTQYVVLTHTNSPFPIHAHFADSDSKRWGAEGPKVVASSTITFGGSFQRIMREHTKIDRPLQFAQVEVTHIAYLSTRTNLSSSPQRMYPLL